MQNKHLTVIKLNKKRGGQLVTPFLFLVYFVCLNKFYFVYVLLFLAVVAFQCAVALVYCVEHRLHRFIVGDAFWVVAFYNAFQNVGDCGCFLVNNLVVSNDIEDYIRSNNREA